jgi:hypothetical protein
MILLPRAAGTVNTPPLIFAPGRAVVIEGAWQTVHPTLLNNASPAKTSAVIGPRWGFRRSHEVGEGHNIDTVVLGIRHRIIS